MLSPRPLSALAISARSATSARWPRHRAAAQDVGVHVGDSLARLRAGIEDNPVAGVRDALGDSYLVGMRDEIGQQSVAGGR